MLSAVLAGERSSAHLVSHSAEWFLEQGIALHTNDPIVRIDRVRRRVHSLGGIELPYDRLLIATGSEPNMLSVPGHNLPGVKSLRDLRDVEAILAAATERLPAVVIGGGVLGLEAASSLMRAGMNVTVVHDRDVLMNRQLDLQAGELLQRQLEDAGMNFCLSAITVAIQGDDRVTSVRLADGRVAPADLVVMAIGVHPSIDLATAAGLRCERGILVDDTMLTI